MTSFFHSLLPKEDAPLGEKCGKAVLGGAAVVLGVKGLMAIREGLQAGARRAMLEEKVEKRRKEREENRAAIRKSLVALDSVQLPELKTNGDYSKNAVEKVVGMNFHELLEALRTDKVPPWVAVMAYQEQALAAQKQTNCVTIFYEEAVAWAKEVEKKWGTSEEKPPLYGMPISVKENIPVKGYDSTKGLAENLHAPAEADAELVAWLRSLGAVPFCQTNTPQCCAAFNCSNPVYGTTSHPLAANRTPGGSSGGEGALLAMRGSLLGLGSDMGGSIRVPCHYSGVTGIKPTVNRVTQKTPGPPSKLNGGVPMIASTKGPMALDVDTCVTFLRLLWSAEDLMQPADYLKDPYTAPLPFNDSPVAPLQENLFTSTKPLRIGYYDFDGWFPAVHACTRAVAETKTLLEAAGHTLVPWAPFDIATSVELFLAAAGAGSVLYHLTENDIPEPHQRYFARELDPEDGRWLKSLRAALTSDERLKRELTFHARSAAEARLVNERIAAYRTNFVAAWQKAGLDAIICPPNASVAMPSDQTMLSFQPFSYSCAYNILNFPGGVVPVTKVTEADVAETTKNYPVTNEASAVVYAANKAGSGSEGLPVGVQIVALPFRDEICLRLMKEVEDGLRGK